MQTHHAAAKGQGSGPTMQIQLKILVPPSPPEFATCALEEDETWDVDIHRDLLFKTIFNLLKFLKNPHTFVELDNNFFVNQLALKIEMYLR